MLVSPSWAKQFPQLIIGQTTRNGGVSQVPYKSFNLGLFTQDKYDSVQENRRRLANYVGISVENWAGGHQVHGSAVRLVKSPMACEGYDAFITTVSGVLLTVTVADCIPVLLYDPVSNSCGAAHAGWRGTVANIVGKTLQAMVEQFSVAPENCYAYVGTSISQPNFEVSHDVAEQFLPHLVNGGFPNDKFRVDLHQANVDQLTAAGCKPENLEVSPFCTVDDNDRFFSYRKEKGTTGRMLAVIGLKK